MTIRLEKRFAKVLKSSGEYLLKNGVGRSYKFYPIINSFLKRKPVKHTKNENLLRFRDFIVPPAIKVENKKKGVLLIGQCFFDNWISEDIPTPFSFTELILQNNLSLLPVPRKPIHDYDVQIVFLPLRVILPEQDYYYGINDEIARLAYQRVDLLLDNQLVLNKEYGLTTFVCNYIVPQKKMLGSLLPKSDSYSDLREFIQQLNEYITQKIIDYSNIYILDIEGLASSYGKRFLSEDVWTHTNHGSLLGNYGYEEWDKDRIEKHPDWSTPYYKFKNEFIEGVWSEIDNSLDVINLVGQVKIIIVDLDDTLWRGVVAEDAVIENSKLLEGWPRGFIEALLILKQRGILLAIASNNDFLIIESLWEEIFRGILKLEDFVAIKINWDDKAVKISQILSEVNLLPNSALFIDDNPRERERIRGVYPDLRVLDEPYFNWKRILLWSSVTQVPKITEESKNKTAMIKDKIDRDHALSCVNREDYLRDLQIKLKPCVLGLKDDTSRAFELLNKTNQFNTAGQKTSRADFDRYLSKGRIYQFSCTDVYSNYGIISLVIIESGTVINFVMSCRVFGLELELAIVSWLQNLIKDTNLMFLFNSTDKNSPAQGFLKIIGEYDNKNKFMIDLEIEKPLHIAILN